MEHNENINVSSIKNLVLPRSKMADMLVQGHQWVTVPNPIKRRALLEACDNCGVVRSANTMLQYCKADADQKIITTALLVISH